MSTNKVQEIITALRSDDVPEPAITTFLWLWGYGMNEIHHPQETLAQQMNIRKRTLRGHLYSLRSAAYLVIDHRYDSPNTLIIKKFTHGQTD